jgi:hypothetical protein
MTWGELKAALTAAGVEDDDIVECLDWTLGSDVILCERYLAEWDDYGPAVHFVALGKVRNPFLGRVN